jgi:cytochrome c biogenesis protein CcdA
MALLILSFIAGVLTVAAPCILPLLPIIVGGSVSSDEADNKKRWYRPLVVTTSLAVSVVVFTLLLKATTTLLGVPQMVWSLISGVIVITLGLNLLFPMMWEKLMIATRLPISSNKLLGKTVGQNSLGKDILTGAALGPVFSSCSPTYALIVAAVLPESFGRGLLYLIAYALGLASVLLLVAIAGQAAVRKLGWLSDPNGWFRRIMGILFIIVGMAVLFGVDKKFQAYVLESGWYDPIMRLEQSLNIE